MRFYVQRYDADNKKWQTLKKKTTYEGAEEDFDRFRENNINEIREKRYLDIKIELYRVWDSKINKVVIA